jgi:hypothetical protein
MTRSRLVAAVVAMALSGVPGLAARALAAAPQSCMCPSHARSHSYDHPCECASRHGAQSAAEQRRPRCHPPAKTPGAAPEPISASCARISGCGTPEPRTAPPPATEPFALPEPMFLAPSAAGERMSVALSPPRDLVLAPETPPPRHG